MSVSVSAIVKASLVILKLGIIFELSMVSFLGRWSLGHCFKRGASVAKTKQKKHESALPKQTKANQVLIQCTQELIELVSYRRNLPAGNILGILAVASAITVADLENCTNGATIFTGHALQADVVLAAVLGMCVTREGAGIGQLTGSGTGKAIGNLCKSRYSIRNQ